MKKSLCFILSVVLLLGVTACGRSDFGDNYEDSDIETEDTVFLNYVSNNYKDKTGYDFDANQFKYKAVDLNQDGQDEYAAIQKVVEKPEENENLLTVFAETEEDNFEKVFEFYLYENSVFKVFVNENDEYALCTISSDPDSDIFSEYCYTGGLETELTKSGIHSDILEDPYCISEECDYFSSADFLDYEYEALSEEEFSEYLDYYNSIDSDLFFENGEAFGFDDFDLSSIDDAEENENEEIIEEDLDIDEDDASFDYDSESEDAITEEESKEETITEKSDSLAPTHKELEELADMANNWRDFDRSIGVADEDVYSGLLSPGGFYCTYNGIFEGCSFVDEGDPDPRAELFSDMGYGYSYYIFPADSVDRYLSEVMGIEPDHNCTASYEGNTICYYEDGYYYYLRSTWGDEDESKYISHTTLSDGTLAVKINISGYDEDRIRESKTVTAKIKIIDGQRVWSIYKIETTYSIW